MFHAYYSCTLFQIVCVAPTSHPLKKSLQVQLAKKPSFRTDYLINQHLVGYLLQFPMKSHGSHSVRYQGLTSCFAARRADRGSATWYLLRNLQSISSMASSPTSCSLCLRLRLARLHTWLLHAVAISDDCSPVAPIGAGSHLGGNSNGLIAQGPFGSKDITCSSDFRCCTEVVPQKDDVAAAFCTQISFA